MVNNIVIRSREIHLITNMIKAISSLLIIHCHITMDSMLWMIGMILVILFVSSFSIINNNSIIPISKALATKVEDNNHPFVISVIYK